MAEDLAKYGLDLHCTMILEEYRAMLPAFERIKEVVLRVLNGCLKSNNLLVIAVEARVKEEKSLAGKLELKGSKYASLSDLTDILGARIITFYSSDVDKIAALVENTFEIDWANSVDKRKMHELDSFGYMSLHFICRIPKSLYSDPEYPEINDIRFELQMRTALQHVWANMYHDTGYKSGVEVPREYLRSLNRLAGLLELADSEFSRIRSDISDYRRKVESLVAGGRFGEVPLNGDTFRSYLALGPFDSLNARIADINCAEIHQASALQYLSAFKLFGFTTLGDIEKLRQNFSESAYQLAQLQIGGTDLDIISSTLALQNLCIVYLLVRGAGKAGLVTFYDTINGKSSYNNQRADRVMAQAQQLPFMQNEK